MILTKTPSAAWIKVEVKLPTSILSNPLPLLLLSNVKR